MTRIRLLVAAAAIALPAYRASAQTFPVADPALRRIWAIGMDSSHVGRLAQTLSDSIGPRLTASPAIQNGQTWLMAMYRAWGVPARREQYGTWRGWKRGISHVDLLTPRVRSLEGTMLAWSPGTKGPVTAEAVTIPNVREGAAFDRWLSRARGKFVLVSRPEFSCRPDSNWKQWATADSFDRMLKQRTSDTAAWNARMRATVATAPREATAAQLLAQGARELPARLEAAGAKGIITSTWSAGWGVDKIFQARTTTIPTVDLSCEDYGLVYRLAENSQGPTLRVEAESEMIPEVPVFNTIAEIRGSEKPNEYVMLSAHFDSWDASSGSTDNGTGTVAMMEAMRILRAAYPRPKRTIMVAHWSGEEQGLNGSRGYAADHPEIVQGMQALFNQDNGTGRIVNISMSGLATAGGLWGKWAAKLPTEIARNINWTFPGIPGGGGSDYASFLCYGAPAFSLGSIGWDYGTYTWHTNRDTFDKIVIDDLKNNATLIAMLAYLASEEPETMPREKRVMPADPRTGQPTPWPACTAPARTVQTAR